MFDDGRKTKDEGRKTDETVDHSSFVIRPVLVLGLGNPLQGDDGVGCRAIEALQQYTLPETVETLDGGTPGIGLLHLLEGRRRAILVDAAEMGQPAGTIVRFRAADVTLAGAAERLSLHRTAVADALALAEALTLSLPDIVFFGVQPERVGWGQDLSPKVAAAVPQVVQAILHEISHDPKEGIHMPTKKEAPETKGLILIVDDDPDMVEALRMPLEAHRYSVAHAASGRLALKMIPELRPDLIILDVMMETTTEGFQVSLALRSPDPRSEYAAYKDIPILMLTSIHSTTPLRFGPDQDYLPVDEFIDKPVDPDKLVAKINALLARK